MATLSKPLLFRSKTRPENISQMLHRLFNNNEFSLTVAQEENHYQASKMTH